MTDKKVSKKFNLNAILVYPKVFNLADTVDPETGESMAGKPGDVDRGDAKSTKKWLRELAKNPKSTLQAYFTSEDQIAELEEHPDFERMVLNPQTGDEVDRIKEGNSEYGIGKYISLNRPMSDVKEFVDRKTGDLKEVDYGGPVRMKTAVVGEGGKLSDVKDYDYFTLGPISNGSRGIVKFEPRYMRLEAIAVTDLVEFVPNTEEDF